jgi:hypothetical protein
MNNLNLTRTTDQNNPISSSTTILTSKINVTIENQLPISKTSIIGNSQKDKLLSFLDRHPIDAESQQKINEFLIDPIKVSIKIDEIVIKNIQNEINANKTLNIQAINKFLNSPVMTKDNFEIEFSFFPFDFLFFPQLNTKQALKCSITGTFAHQLLKNWLSTKLNQIKTKENLDLTANLLKQLIENFESELKKSDEKKVFEFECPTFQHSELVIINLSLINYLTEFICTDLELFEFYKILLSKTVCKIEDNPENHFVSTFIGDLEIRFKDNTSLPIDVLEIPIHPMIHEIKKNSQDDNYLYKLEPLFPICKIPEKQGNLSSQLNENSAKLKLNVFSLEDKALDILNKEDSILSPLAFQLLLLYQRIEPNQQRVESILECLPMIVVTEKSSDIRCTLLLQIQTLLADLNQNIINDGHRSLLNNLVQKENFDGCTFAFSWAEAMQFNNERFNKALTFWKKYLSQENQKKFGLQLLKSFGPNHIKQAFRIFKLISELGVKDENRSLQEMLQKCKINDKKKFNLIELHDLYLIAWTFLEPSPLKEKDIASSTLGKELSWLIQELINENSPYLAADLLNKAFEMQALSVDWTETPFLYAKVCQSMLDATNSNVLDCLKIWKRAFDAGIWSANTQPKECDDLTMALGEKLRNLDQLEIFLFDAIMLNLNEHSLKFLRSLMSEQLQKHFEKLSIEKYQELLKKYQLVLTPEELRNVSKFQKIEQSEERKNVGYSLLEFFLDISYTEALCVFEDLLKVNVLNAKEEWNQLKNLIEKAQNKVIEANETYRLAQLAQYFLAKLIEPSASGKKSHKQKSKPEEPPRIQNEISWLINKLYQQELYEDVHSLFCAARTKKILTGKHSDYESLGLLACHSLLLNPKKDNLKSCIDLWKELKEQEKLWLTSSPEHANLLVAISERLFKEENSSSDLEYFILQASMEKLDAPLKEKLSTIACQLIHSSLDLKKIKEVEEKLKKFSSLLEHQQEKSFITKIYNYFMNEAKYLEACQKFKLILKKTHLFNEQALNQMAKELLNKLNEPKLIDQYSQNIEELWQTISKKNLFKNDEKFTFLLESLQNGLKSESAEPIPTAFYNLAELLLKVTEKELLTKESLIVLAHSLTKLIQNNKADERKTFKEKLSVRLEKLISILANYGLAKEISLLLAESEARQVSAKKTKPLVFQAFWAFSQFLEQKDIEINRQLIVKIHFALEKLQLEIKSPLLPSDSNPEEVLYTLNLLLKANLEKPFFYVTLIRYLSENSESEKAISWIKILWHQWNEFSLTLNFETLFLWMECLLEKKEEEAVAKEILDTLHKKIRTPEDIKIVNMCRLKIIDNAHKRFLQSQSSDKPETSLILVDESLLKRKEEFKEQHPKETSAIVKEVIKTHLNNKEHDNAIKLMQEFKYFSEDTELLRILFQEASFTKEENTVNSLYDLFHTVKSDSFFNNRPNLYTACWISLINAFANIKRRLLLDYLKNFQKIIDVFEKPKDDLIVLMIGSLCSHIFNLNFFPKNPLNQVEEIIKPFKLSFKISQEIKLSYIRVCIKNRQHFDHFTYLCTVLEEMIETSQRNQNAEQCQCALLLLCDSVSSFEPNEINHVIKKLQVFYSAIENLSLQNESKESRYLEQWNQVFKLKLTHGNQSFFEQISSLNIILNSLNTILQNKTDKDFDLVLEYEKFIFQTAIEIFSSLLYIEKNPFVFFRYAFETMYILEKGTSTKGLPKEIQTPVPQKIKKRITNIEQYCDNFHDMWRLNLEKKDVTQLNDFKLSESFETIQYNSFCFLSILLKGILNINSDSDVVTVSLWRMSQEIGEILLHSFPEKYEDLNYLFQEFRTTNLEIPSLRHQMYRYFYRRLFLIAYDEKVFKHDSAKSIYKRQLYGLCLQNELIKLNQEEKNEVFRGVIKYLLSGKNYLGRKEMIATDQVYNIQHAIEVFQSYNVTDENLFVEIFYKIFEQATLTDYQFAPVSLVKRVDKNGEMAIYKNTVELVCYFFKMISDTIDFKFVQAPKIMEEMINHLIKQQNPPYRSLSSDILKLLNVLEEQGIFVGNYSQFLKLLENYLGRTFQEFRKKGQDITIDFILERHPQVLYKMPLNAEENAIRLNVMSQWLDDLLSIDSSCMLDHVIKMFFAYNPIDSQNLFSFYKKMTKQIIQISTNSLENQSKDKAIIHIPIYHCLPNFMDKAKKHPNSSEIFHCLADTFIEIYEKQKNKDQFILTSFLQLIKDSIEKKYISKINNKILDYLFFILRTGSKNMFFSLDIFFILNLIVDTYDVNEVALSVLLIVSEIMTINLKGTYAFDFRAILNKLKTSNIDQKILQEAIVAAEKFMPKNDNTRKK